MPSSKKSQSNSIVKYEFGGPLGAFGIIFGLPLVIYLLYFTCNADFCLTFARIWDLKCMRFVSEINVYLEVNRLFSLEALSMYLLWMSLQLFYKVPSKYRRKKKGGQRKRIPVSAGNVDS